ncbi:hypothetical protein AAHA92_14291 [Salvia divinorum]|uniref:SET domain-containing protein n=1 Tax=Salvia divinorum TaxID=28513 RepID=A0ABD1HB33_SALDI
MAFLFQKFQEAVKVLAKSPTFAKQGRHLQFETDMNKLFLFTSYNRLGKHAEEADADEIIEMGSKANLEEQQKQVQENIHEQISTFCKYMDDILRPDPQMAKPHNSPSEAKTAPRRSGLGLAVGRTTPMDCNPSMVVPETKMIKLCEVSKNLKDLLDYTLEIKPSQIQHKDAGQGLFLDGEADVGTVIAVYPGITYSPAYYRYIPGYPRVDLENPYLITRYDGTVINAQPWGTGGEAREMWNGSGAPQTGLNAEGGLDGSDRMWKLLSKPLDGSKTGGKGVVLERRHPLALAHFANHPPKDSLPNVMVCPYDFPLTEQNTRTYIPNVPFGGGQEVSMKKFGTFWFKSWKSSGPVADVPVIKSLVLVATRAISNEEILLNYRLSNSKRRPSWYTPVDEDEDRRRWS